MDYPLQSEPLSLDGLIDGDILTIGRWQAVRPNPKTSADWSFQQFDVVFTTGEEDGTTMDAETIELMRTDDNWVVFAIKRPQTAPPTLEPVEAEETPTDS